MTELAFPRLKDQKIAPTIKNGDFKLLLLFIFMMILALAVPLYAELFGDSHTLTFVMIIPMVFCLAGIFYILGISSKDFSKKYNAYKNTLARQSSETLYAMADHAPELTGDERRALKSVLNDHFPGWSQRINAQACVILTTGQTC